jgi:hypothetical protein
LTCLSIDNSIRPRAKLSSRPGLLLVSLFRTDLSAWPDRVHFNILSVCGTNLPTRPTMSRPERWSTLQHILQQWHSSNQLRISSKQYIRPRELPNVLQQWYCANDVQRWSNRRLPWPVWWRVNLLYHFNPVLLPDFYQSKRWRADE